MRRIIRISLCFLGLLSILIGIFNIVIHYKATREYFRLEKIGKIAVAYVLTKNILYHDSDYDISSIYERIKDLLTAGKKVSPLLYHIKYIFKDNKANKHIINEIINSVDCREIDENSKIIIFYDPDNPEYAQVIKKAALSIDNKKIILPIILGLILLFLVSVEYIV